MQGSDDYFTDDFVLDDTALAFLDEEEHKYTLSTQNPAPPYAPPPPKRLKTESGWRHRPSNRPAEIIDDLDDLPEISVQGDGSYGLHARHAAIASTRPSDVRNGISVNGENAQLNSSSRLPAIRTVSSSSSAGQQRRGPSVDLAQRRTSHSTASPSSSIPPTTNSQSSHRAQAAKVFVQDKADVEAQVDELRHQMEELRNDNEKIQSALQDAVNKRMAKEGEVSVLRKNIEKTAEQHSAQVAKLRAMKEEADAKQAQMQREIKEEMERLRTQYTFKQHELETSVRKSQWSVRPRRTNTEAPSSPIIIPAQMHSWNANSDTRAAGPSNYVHETPGGPRFSTLAKESPKTIRNRKQVLADSPKKSAKLPGFYNSFDTLTPVRGNRGRNAMAKNGDMSDIRDGDRKGKARASVLGQQSQFSNTGPPPPSPPSSPTRGRTVADVGMPSDDTPAYAMSTGNAAYDYVGLGVGDMDIEMMDDEPMCEELDEIRSPKWREELHRMILTHTTPSSTVVTIQTLMKASSDITMPASSMEAYSDACTRILEVLASTSYHIDWESALYAVAKSLTDMAYILNAANLISPLTGLLSLLTNLSYSLPSFSSFLLSAFEENADGHSPTKILVIFRDIVRNHLTSTSVTIKNNHNDVIKFLALNAIGLVESLCWNIPEEFEGQLVLIPRSPQVLSILLDASQPLWLLCRSAQLLVVLSSRSNLFRSLLSYPDPETPAGNEAAKEFTKIPHIERLCSILVDTSLRGTESHSLRDSILTFFTMLSLANADALTILLESVTLIPSLVVYLTQLTTPFREDDMELMTSPSTITTSIRAISRTVIFLNYLVFSTEPTCNLRQKLHHAPHRQYNGITYMFIVTFGTLSYADPPSWIDDSDKHELEHIAEMARDLLDLVVEGPESDSVYAAFQCETDQGSVTDDEEMEARLLDANVV